MDQPTSSQLIRLTNKEGVNPSKIKWVQRENYCFTVGLSYDKSPVYPSKGYLVVCLGDPGYQEFLKWLGVNVSK